MRQLPTGQHLLQLWSGFLPPNRQASIYLSMASKSPLRLLWPLVLPTGAQSILEAGCLQWTPTSTTNSSSLSFQVRAHPACQQPVIQGSDQMGFLLCQGAGRVIRRTP